MKRIVTALAALAILVLVACGGDKQETTVAAGGGGETTEEAKELTPLNLSYVNSVASLGQYSEVIERSDVMEQHGIDATLHGFPSAAEVATAAAAGSIDQYLGSDIGLTGLLARGEDWTIVGGSVGWRFGFAVPEDSDIQGLADLKGKKVGIPFGVSTQVYLELALQDAGLDTKKDVEIVNVPIDKIGSALAGGAVDAIGGWDPALSSVPDSKLIYEDVAGTGRDYPAIVIAFPTEVVETQRDLVVSYLAASIQAIWYAIQNSEQTTQWFSESSQIPVEALDRALEFEPLWQAGSIEDISLQLTDSAVKQMNANADFFAAADVIPETVDLTQYWDKTIAAEAEELVKEQGPLELNING